MHMEAQEKKSWSERLKHTYRLVIMRHDTLEEVSSYKLSLLNIYVLISSVFVVLAILMWLLIAFTPLRRYVPGYGTGGSPKELKALAREVSQLEQAYEAQSQYTENLRRMLAGEVETEADFSESPDESVVDSLQPLDTPEEDELLRREAELQAVGVLVREGSSATTRLNYSETPLEQLYFTPPVKGEISAGFMPEKDHYGVDVLAPRNTAIKAVMDGYVFLSDWTLETGNTIGIQHPNNLITFYKHNSALLKKAGSFVKAGEAVAIIGNTGTLTDGPHLHFEIWHKGKPVDPASLIQF